MYFLTILLLSTASFSSDTVAIFDGGANFPYYGAPDNLEPQRLLATLEAIRIHAEILNAATLSDPVSFNAQKYAALIHIYGNTFPLIAAENLRQFHRDGGSILATAVPFCHPCVAVGIAGWGDEWGDSVTLTEESHTGRYALKITHRTGDWSGPASERIPISLSQDVNKDGKVDISDLILVAQHFGEIIIPPADPNPDVNGDGKVNILDLILTAIPREKPRYRISGWVQASEEAQGSDYLFVRFFDSPGAFLGQQGPRLIASKDWLKVGVEVSAPEDATWLDVSPQAWTKGVTILLDDISLVNLQNGEQLLYNGGFETVGRTWKDLGHTNDWFDAQKGIGLGSFEGPVASGNSTVRLEKDDPLHLSNLGVPSEIQRPAQWLDASSLPEGTSVTGIFGVYEEGDLRGFMAALIRTPKGTIDLWAGSTPNVSRLYDEFLMRQILVRGAVVALTERGLWTETRRDESFEKLDALPGPRTMENLIPPDEPRLYLTFFPKPPKPAERLLVVDVRYLPSDEKLLLTSLQGLVNRKQPQIYLLFNDNDRRWLDWFKHTGRVQSEDIVSEPLSLVWRFKESYRGAVIPDHNLYIGPVIACNVAGAQDLLIASERLAVQLGLTVLQDLRGRFHDNASALRWVVDELFEQLSHHLLICAHPSLAYNGSFDYIIQHRGIAFWLTGSVDGRRPDSDMVAEQEVVEGLFAKLPVNIPVRGFWYAGEGVGPGEVPGVTLGSRFGKVLVCSDLIANLSVHSGYTLSSLQQKPQPPAPKLEQDKVYLAFTMSDGDNLCTLYGYFPSYFEDDLHGTFPMGWGIGPTIIDLAPAIVEWYYENAAPTDEFFCDVSGIGYIYPPEFATKYINREVILDDFLLRTQEYMGRLDLHTIRPAGTDESHIQRYGTFLKGLHSLVPDYGRATGGDLDRATYMLPNGIPVFRGFTDWEENHPDLARYMADQIRRQVGGQRPAFINVFVWNWGYRLQTLKRVLDLLPSDFVAVTPEQLAQLYQRSQSSQKELQ